MTAASVRPRVSLGIKILALFLPLSLLPVAVAGIVAFRYAEQAIVDNNPDPRRELARLSDLRGSALLVGDLALSLSLVGAGVTALLVVKPLGRLKDGTARVARGDFDVSLPVDGGDEIAELTRAFNAMAAALAAYRDDLVRAESAAAVGRLASMVAHEVRNPLNAIRGCADLLRLRRADDEVVAHHAEVIAEETANLDAFVASFLGYTRMPAPKLAPLDVAALLRARIDLHRPESETRRIDLVVEADPACPPIDGDPQQLAIVFENLAHNAFDAMPAGGVLTVTTRCDAERVRITFTDTGPGIAPGPAAHLFTPFFTTKKNGTGLGLPTSRRIAELHGGALRWRNEPDRGAAFEVELPVSRLAALGEKSPAMTASGR